MEHEFRKFDAVIVGHGPAGCSAALYLCRAGFSVALVGKDGGALTRAEKIENYYGLPEPLPGTELIETGLQQCAALGAVLLDDEVLSLEWREDGSYLAALAGGDALLARGVLLATGKAKRTPKIPGVAAFEGKGVSYCAVCDAFFYRGKNVAILGGGAYAKHEMEQLLPLAAQVTLLTHGADLTFAAPEGVAVRTEPVVSVGGADTLGFAALEGGDELLIDGLFVALGSASAGDLAMKLGLRLQDNAIPVDGNQATDLPGLYAAGDCTGTFPQVAFAVAEGAKAGLSMMKYFRR